MLSLSPVAESATLLRRVGVVVGSVLVTLGYCLDVLWRAAFRRLDRARVDRYTRGWASKLLRLVRLQVSVFGKAPDFSDGSFNAATNVDTSANTIDLKVQMSA